MLSKWATEHTRKLIDDADSIIAAHHLKQNIKSNNQKIAEIQERIKTTKAVTDMVTDMSHKQLIREKARDLIELMATFEITLEEKVQTVCDSEDRKQLLERYKMLDSQFQSKLENQERTMESFLKGDVGC